MIPVRRALLYAALALCAPLPALALGDSPRRGPEPGGFAVTVALDRCGLLDARILCKLDLAFDPPEGATSHTATVTPPDGSVIELGEVGAGGASIWVPYAGDGTYTVEVAAYGDPAEAGGEAKLLARERAVAEGPGGGVDPPGDEGPERPGSNPADGIDEGADAEAEPDGAETGEPGEPGCTAAEIAEAEAFAAAIEPGERDRLEAEGELPAAFECLGAVTEP